METCSYLGLVNPADLDIAVDGDAHEGPDTVDDEEVEHGVSHVAVQHAEHVHRLHLREQLQHAVRQKEEEENADVVDGLGDQVGAGRWAHRLLAPDDNGQEVAHKADDDERGAAVGAGDVVHAPRGLHDVVAVDVAGTLHHDVRGVVQHSQWFIHRVELKSWLMRCCLFKNVI